MSTVTAAIRPITPAPKEGEEVADGVTFEYGDAKEYGFLKFTVSGGQISGSYTGVRPGTMPAGSDAAVSAAKDTFSIPISS